MLALSRSDVQRLVPMPEAIELMKIAFAELSAGRTNSPLRINIPVTGVRGDSLYMPGYVPALGALGLKVVSVFYDNPKLGLPVINAMVTLVDAETGVPMAIMDGTYLTALRTGAISGATTDLLARKDAKTLVAVGAGAQGATQIAAVCAVRPIERIIAVDVFPESLERLKGILARDWPNVVSRMEYSTDANAAVAQADVVCTATTSKTPVFDFAAVQPGTHINAVGSYTPEMQELPSDLVVNATLVVDATEAALHESGDLIIPLNQGLVAREHFTVELGMLVNGHNPGRTSNDEVTLFKSVGNAVQDVVVARRAYDKAIADGSGVSFDLS